MVLDSQDTTAKRTKGTVVTTTVSFSPTQPRPSPTVLLWANCTWKSPPIRSSPCWDRFSLLTWFHLEWMRKNHIDLHADRRVSSHLRRNLFVRTEFAEESRNDPRSIRCLQTGRSFLGRIYTCRYVQRDWTDSRTFEWRYWEWEEAIVAAV